MARNELSRRLLTIGEQVLPGEAMADIGSDHGLLPCYLVGEGICPHAVIGELKDGPYRRALNNVVLQGLSDRIEVRQGDGLAVLKEGEVSTVVIAGMGGNTITQILERGGSKTDSFKRLVLQPMNYIDRVRAFLAQKGMPIEGEKVIFDREYYVVLVAGNGKGVPYILSKEELLFGPCIVRSVDQREVRDYLEHLLQKYEAILTRIKSNGGARSSGRAEAVSTLIQMLEGILR